MISQPDPSPIDGAVIIAVALTPLLILLVMRIRLFLLRHKTRKLKARLDEMRQVWEENERRAREAGIELKDKQGLFS